MIWFLMGIMVLAALLFVTQPLYTKQAPKAVPDTEVENYAENIANLEAQIAEGGDNVRALENTKTQLQRQVLASTSKTLAVDTGPSGLLLSTLFIGAICTAGGLYYSLGRPELTKAGALQSPAAAANANASIDPNMSLEEIVARLEQKLAKDDNNTEGWMMYARSLMNLGRYDEALVAYEKIIVQTNSHPNVVKEFESAKAFIESQKQSGPSAQDVQAAAAMSEQERAEMIAGMVDRLAQKLKDNPQDRQGWMRLLQARKVMGQDQQARADIERMEAAFEGQPEIIAEILKATGWQSQ